MKVVDLFRSVTNSAETAYVVSADRRLIRTNERWRTFAMENGGASVLERWKRGASIDDALPGPLRAFYVAAFDRALASGETWEHVYECSSPEALRRFRMRVYPCEGSFLVVVHSLVVEEPHSRAANDPGSYAYEHAGVITMCSHCRRTKRDDQQAWDWVPAFVAFPPMNISHGLCKPCCAYYYGSELAS